MKVNNHLLFSYGTLQLASVQLANYGRVFKGVKDRLPGYKIEKLQITDSDVLAKSQVEFHPIAIKTGNRNDTVEGMVYEISDEELLASDKYEVSQYERVLETFESGRKAWVYVAKSNVL